MAHLLSLALAVLVAAPSPGATTDATADATTNAKIDAQTLPSPTPAAQPGQRAAREPSPPTGSRPASRGIPQPLDLSSHPAWDRYFRGKKLRGIGWGLTVTATLLTGLFVMSMPVALIGTGFSSPGDIPRIVSGMAVGTGVPILVLLYSGISLLVKGGRMRDRAVLEIFGPPDPRRPSIRVELGPGGLGLRGRF